jgi:hypothetical protein
MRAAHAGQVQKKRHASVGMRSTARAPHAGQVRVLSRISMLTAFAGASALA